MSLRVPPASGAHGHPASLRSLRHGDLSPEELTGRFAHPFIRLFVPLFVDTHRACGAGAGTPHRVRSTPSPPQGLSEASGPIRSRSDSAARSASRRHPERLIHEERFLWFRNSSAPSHGVERGCGGLRREPLACQMAVINLAHGAVLRPLFGEFSRGARVGEAAEGRGMSHGRRGDLRPGHTPAVTSGAGPFCRRLEQSPRDSWGDHVLERRGHFLALWPVQSAFVRKTCQQDQGPSPHTLPQSRKRACLRHQGVWWPQGPS